MNIIPLKIDGEFLCIQKFYPVFQSEGAVVVWGYRQNGEYVLKEVQSLPFVHRIETVRFAGEDYLMCASLCKTKKYTDDWDYPGSIYVGRIDYKNREILELREVYSGIYQNHGLTKIGETGEEGILISGRNGVNRLIPPGTADGKWNVVCEIEEAVSDCVAADIDGDGEPEYGVIEPFHGAFFHIYKRIDGKMQKIYTLNGTHSFGHAIWGGNFNGENVFLVGFRDAGKELYLVSGEGGIGEHLVDAGAGPANVTVIRGNGEDLICAANRQSDRYTIYRRKK